jgi:hypothetical protein
VLGPAISIPSCTSAPKLQHRIPLIVHYPSIECGVRSLMSLRGSRCDPPFVRFEPCPIRLGSRVSHSLGWLGSATEGRRPQVQGWCSGGSSRRAGTRPQPPTICHPSWPDLEPGPRLKAIVPSDCAGFRRDGGCAAFVFVGRRQPDALGCLTIVRWHATLKLC